MTERYLGSIITASPTEPSEGLENSLASGVWHIHDPLIFGQAGDWPTAGRFAPMALFFGGEANSGMVNTIDKINISSDGNASDFGDLLAAGQNISGCCNGSRAIMMAGKSSSSNQTNVI